MVHTHTYTHIHIRIPMPISIRIPIRIRRRRRIRTRIHVNIHRLWVCIALRPRSPQLWMVAFPLCKDSRITYQSLMVAVTPEILRSSKIQMPVRMHTMLFKKVGNAHNAISSPLIFVLLISHWFSPKVSQNSFQFVVMFAHICCNAGV